MNVKSLFYLSIKSRFVVLLYTAINALFTYNFFSIDDRGYLTFLLSINFFLTYCTFWPETYIQKEISTDYKMSGFIKLISWHFVKMTSLIIFFALSFILLYFFSGRLGFKLGYDYLAVVISFFLTILISPVVESVVLAHGLFKEADYFNYIKVFSLIISCFVAYYNDLNVVTFFVFSSILTTLSISIVSWIFLYKIYGRLFKFTFSILKKIRIQELSEYVRMSFPIYIMTILFAFSQTLPILIINKIIGLSEVAIYGLYLSFFSIVSSFAQRLESYFITTMSVSYGKSKSFDSFENYILVYFLFNFLLILLFVRLQSFFVSYLFGHEYIIKFEDLFLFSMYFIVKPFGIIRHIYYITDQTLFLLRASSAKYTIECFLMFTLGISFGITGILFASILSLALYYCVLYANVPHVFEKMKYIYISLIYVFVYSLVMYFSQQYLIVSSVIFSILILATIPYLLNISKKLILIR